MLKGKIYDYMKKYLDAYLYDFDEKKLGMSFLSGKIQLNDMHIRQDMANRLIDSFGIPVSMKAGLIQNVSVSFSVLNFWSSPLELEINDVHLVLGPSTYFQSNDESYIEEPKEDILNHSYDSTNAFNVFEHEMKIKANTVNEQIQANLDQNIKNLEELKYLATTDFLKARLLDEESQVKNVRLIFKNIQLTIKRLHIRYEDDHYSAALGKKFAFGVTIDQLNVFSGVDDWDFTSDLVPKQDRNKTGMNQSFLGRGNPVGDAQFTRVPIDSRQKFKEYASDSVNLLIKEVRATSVQIYYDNTGQIMIPSSVIEAAENAGAPIQVYVEVPVKKIIEQMSSVFQQSQREEQNPRNPFLVVEKFQLQAHIFSYRAVDFEGLYQFLQTKLGAQSYGDNKINPNRPQWAQKLGASSRASLNKDIHRAQFQYFRNEFSLKFAIQPLIPGQNIIVNVTPSLLSGIQAFNYYLENYYIALDLKQYRPQRRPITPSMLEGVSKKVIRSEKFVRKRKNVVRDWLYYIVWYVRLKKILDNHKYDQVSASPISILFGRSPSQAAQSEIKSPIQDPTQLTRIAFTFGFPALQFKFFESNQKMTEFYILCSQTQNAQSQAQARRLAPLSISFQKSHCIYDNDIIQQQIQRDVRLQGVDVILTKIQDNRGAFKETSNLETTRLWDAQRKLSGRPKFEPLRSNRQQSKNMFNTHKFSALDFSTGHNQSLMGDQNNEPYQSQSFVEQQQQAYVPQEYQAAPSLWMSLFNAFKNLFNMNGQAEIAYSSPKNYDSLRGNMNLRNSFHRGFQNAGSGQDSTPQLGIIGRSSILQNAQLEVTRVDNKKIGLKQEMSFSRNGPRNRSPFRPNVVQEQSTLLNIEDDEFHQLSAEFVRNVKRHQCYRVENMQASNSQKVFEVIQYPIFKTSDWISDCDNLLNLSVKIAKNNSIQLECDIDRSVEITYCVSDILDVLISPQNGVAQQYIKIIHRYMDENGYYKKKSVFLNDFKPLWAIKRSMRQQASKMIKSGRPIQQSPRISVVAKDMYKGSDGENIIDDEGDPENPLSQMQCKPSITKSNQKFSDNTSDKTRKSGYLGTHQNVGIRGRMNTDRKSIGGIPQTMSMARDHNNGHFEDKYLYETLMKYGRMFGAAGEPRDKNEAVEPTVIIDIRINCPIQMQVLSGDDQARGAGYQTVSKLKVQPSNLFFQRSQLHSSFQAFGLEFESTNKIKVLQLFARQLNESMRTFIGNPLIQEHLQGEKIYEMLKESIRAKLYLKKMRQPTVFKKLNKPLKQQSQIVPRESITSRGFESLRNNISPRRSLNQHPKINKHKTMRQGHEPAQEAGGSDSSTGSLANRIYQGLEDEHDQEDGNPSTMKQQIPVQIKQVSQLNMQIIYNNITGEKAKAKE